MKTRKDIVYEGQMSPVARFTWIQEIMNIMMMQHAELNLKNDDNV